MHAEKRSSGFHVRWYETINGKKVTRSRAIKDATTKEEALAKMQEILAAEQAQSQLPLHHDHGAGIVVTDEPPPKQAKQEEAGAWVSAREAATIVNRSDAWLYINSGKRGRKIKTRFEGSQREFFKPDLMRAAETLPPRQSKSPLTGNERKKAAASKGKAAKRQALQKMNEHLERAHTKPITSRLGEIADELAQHIPNVFEVRINVPERVAYVDQKITTTIHFGGAK